MLPAGPVPFPGGPLPAVMDGVSYQPTPPSGPPVGGRPEARVPPVMDMGAARHPSATQGAGSAAEARAHLNSSFWGRVS